MKKIGVDIQENFSYLSLHIYNSYSVAANAEELNWISPANTEELNWISCYKIIETDIKFYDFYGHGYHNHVLIFFFFKEPDKYLANILPNFFVGHVVTIKTIQLHCVAWKKT